MKKLRKGLLTLLLACLFAFSAFAADLPEAAAAETQTQTETAVAAGTEGEAPDGAEETEQPQPSEEAISAGEENPADDPGQEPEEPEKEPEPFDLALVRCLTGAGNAETVVRNVEGVGSVLFLPASADLHALVLQLPVEEAVLRAGGTELTIQSGVPFDFAAHYPAAPADGRYAFSLNGTALFLMHSEQIASIYLTSADPEKDRTWVELSKENKAKGSMTMLGADGHVIYSGELKQIKGRGNSTWGWEKKPYQIKLAEACDLIETGDPLEAEKTWVLLANYADETLIRNQVAFALAQGLGMAFTPNCRPVDLYYDGEYRGSYLLSEKTEVGTGRVAVEDLEGEIEDLNPDADMDELPTKEGENAYGNTYQYVEGLILPSDISGGYLLEMDFEVRAKLEKSWFTTTDGLYLVCKSPEYLESEGVSYISELFQRLENALVNGGTDPETGRDYRELVDFESLVKAHLLQEIAQDQDSYASSQYFYKKAGDDVLYCGPVWDFDLAFGNDQMDAGNYLMFAEMRNFGQYLMRIPSFQSRLLDLCQGEFNTLISGLLYGSGGMKSIDDYADEVRSSGRMDRLLWPATAKSGSYDQAVEELKYNIHEHFGYMARHYEQVVEKQTSPVHFWDVWTGDWFYDAVKYVYLGGIMNGYSEYVFAPEDGMTRAMVVTMLYRMAGSPQIDAAASFPDVPEGMWYSEAVSWAVGAGVAEGYPEGNFLPDQLISRAELCTFLSRYEKFLHPDAPAVDTERILTVFEDQAAIQDWSREAVAWAVSQGIVNGMTPAVMQPDGTATRAQAATVFMRYLEPEERLDPPEPAPEETDPDTGGTEGSAGPSEETEPADPAETYPVQDADGADPAVDPVAEPGESTGEQEGL